MIIVDVWGGKNSMDHVARYILPIDDAVKLAATELENGYLVNLRKDAKFGPDNNFDTRLNAGDE